MKEKKVQFWTYDEGNIPKISHSKLIDFLNDLGFAKVKINEINTFLVKQENNRIKISNEEEIRYLILEYLKANANEAVVETYVKGISSYVSKNKLDLLNQVELIDDRDSKINSNFYFNNVFCNVTNDAINVLEYDKLNFVIWVNRLIKRNFNMAHSITKNGQFEIFCKNITFKDDERFLALKTTLGYLLHRNKEVGESKAVIFYDEKMGEYNQVHGGTGKTLLSLAIKECRELEIFDGKEIKEGSYFKNQRIDYTTDVIAYDDLKANFNFETFFPTITSGIEVEKKGKQSFYIEQGRTPKLIISSNYIVKGPGGPSDERRRHEFEIANYYNVEFTPEVEFGNRFFGNDWDESEWNKFYLFMMSCTQDYLKHGLLKAAPINLRQNKLIEKSCPEFIEFADNYIKINEWIDKRALEDKFKEFYSNFNNVSSHLFSKWITSYSNGLDCEYIINSSGGNYNFILQKKEVKEGKYE